MKKLLSLGIVAVLLFALVGCGGQAPNVPVKDIVDAIGSEVESTGNLMETDLTNEEMAEANKEFAKAYGIDLEDIEEGIIKAPMINLLADEVIVIKAKDDSKIAGIKEGLTKHVENQLAAFENYVPENYEIVKNHILKSQGNYILLAISKDAEKIEETFDNALK